ncbi:hypothetical protein VBD025_16015 [Virgibacillus flavescens]|uniref:hypothetical protein n=1 Tax=Virgibacillus flavescens TaxID=1611422 RepID=UPI003D32F942
MEGTQWDIREVIHLKKIQLVQDNFFMLLIFVLFGYMAENGMSYVLIGAACILSWIAVAVSLYTLITGRSFGTKTRRRVQEFDRDRSGEKRWKRKKIAEIIIFSVIGVIITSFIFDKGINSARLDFPLNALPFFGVWVGHNVGEIIRMNKL